jgi:ABC-type nitrate/sulfonate/bicarbonate transport system permease component
MLFAIIIAFVIGGSLGFLMACLLCSSRTTERNVYFPERFYRDPLHPASGKFLAN